MRRRWLVCVPAVSVAAALLGSALSGNPLLAVVLAAGVGGAVAVGLDAAVGRRIGRLADRVTGFPEWDADASALPVDQRPWQRLEAALDVVQASAARRIDELAEERARGFRLLERLPPAIMLFTEDRLAYANAAARHLFALDGAPTQARSVLQVLGVRALADAVVEARETGRAIEVEVVRDARALLGRASVTVDAEVALVVTDLTEARRVEAVRRDFVTNASHELKTPVAGMQALAESLALALARDPDRARRMVERLQHESARLAQLVRNLLDLSRLEESTERARQRVDLVEVIRGQEQRLNDLAVERQVKLVSELPHAASLVAVPEDLRVIVGNLMENAVRYNRPGGSVSVRVRRRRGQVVLEVADDGIGIPEAEQTRVFERFYRVDKARSRAAGGTGLGLSLVRHAAQRQGGNVMLQSVLGEGTTVRVVLPVAAEAPS